MKIYKTKMPMERYPKTTMPFLLTEYIEIDRNKTKDHQAKREKDEHSRGRTCNPQIRSLMRFHCAICPYNY